MARQKSAREAVTETDKELGYPAIKPEQVDVAVTFVEGRDVFCCASYWIRKKVSVTPACK